MNKNGIDKALAKLEKCVRDGYDTEAFLCVYHLNLGLLLHFASILKIRKQVISKPKQLVTALAEAVKLGTEAKIIINGKNLKMIKVWMKKTDQYFKLLRIQKPGNTKSLIHETEKIFLLLHISFTKLSARKKNISGE